MNELARELAGQVWAMESDALSLLLAKVSAFDQQTIESVTRALAEKGDLFKLLSERNGTSAINPMRSASSGGCPDVRNGVAHIPINGTMMKQVPCMLDLLGVQATSTEAVRAQLDAALNDSAVKSIVLDIDSPGGTVDGTQALADDVRAVRGLKPIEAHASDKMASAAYWVASQADRIVAGPTASIGSIGTVGAIHDSSQAAEKAGVKVHVISSHELKGAGIPGAPVTDAQLADFRRNVETLTGLFVDAVASGRGISAASARELATGQVWIGEEAKARGLVDEVRSGAPSRVASNQPQVRATAPPGASLENQMDPKEAAAIVAENAKLKAQLEAAEANTKALAAEQKKAILAKFADRFMPAAASAFEKMAEHMDLASLEQHLASLPKVVRDVSAGVVPTVAQLETVANGIASIVALDQTGRQVGGSRGAAQVANWLGTTPAQIDKYSKVVGWFSNGTFQLEDGRVVTAAQLPAALAS